MLHIYTCETIFRVGLFAHNFLTSVYLDLFRINLATYLRPGPRTVGRFISILLLQYFLSQIYLKYDTCPLIIYQNYSVVLKQIYIFENYKNQLACS